MEDEADWQAATTGTWSHHAGNLPPFAVGNAVDDDENEVAAQFN